MSFVTPDAYSYDGETVLNSSFLLELRARGFADDVSLEMLKRLDPDRTGKVSKADCEGG